MGKGGRRLCGRGARRQGAWSGGRVGAGLGEGRHLPGPLAGRGRAGPPGRLGPGPDSILFILQILGSGAGPPHSSYSPQKKLSKSNSSARIGGQGCAHPCLGEGRLSFLSSPFTSQSSQSSLGYGPGGGGGWLHLPCRMAAPFPYCVSASSSSHLGRLSSLGRVPPPLAPARLFVRRGGTGSLGTPPTHTHPPRPHDGGEGWKERCPGPAA